MDAVGIVITGLLVVVSVYSWCVIFERLWFFRGVERGILEFDRMFSRCRTLAEVARGVEKIGSNPLSRLFERGYKMLRESFEVIKKIDAENPMPAARLSSGAFEMQIDLLRQSLGQGAEEEAALLRRRLAVLGTIAAACPFVGLLGTVWGIMVAFNRMGMAGSAEFKVVAGGISTALLTTVAGLVAAIPALVSHNFFVHKSERIGAKIDEFADRLMRLAGRWFFQAVSKGQSVKDSK